MEPNSPKTKAFETVPSSLDDSPPASSQFQELAAAPRDVTPRIARTIGKNAHVRPLFGGKGSHGSSSLRSPSSCSPLRPASLPSSPPVSNEAVIAATNGQGSSNDGEVQEAQAARARRIRRRQEVFQCVDQQSDDNCEETEVSRRNPKMLKQSTTESDAPQKFRTPFPVNPEKRRRPSMPQTCYPIPNNEMDSSVSSNDIRDVIKGASQTYDRQTPFVDPDTPNPLPPPLLLGPVMSVSTTSVFSEFTVSGMPLPAHFTRMATAAADVVFELGIATVKDPAKVLDKRARYNQLAHNPGYTPPKRIRQPRKPSVPVSPESPGRLQSLLEDISQTGDADGTEVARQSVQSQDQDLVFDDVWTELADNGPSPLRSAADHQDVLGRRVEEPKRHEALEVVAPNALLPVKSTSIIVRAFYFLHPILSAVKDVFVLTPNAEVERTAVTRIQEKLFVLVQPTVPGVYRLTWAEPDGGMRTIPLRYSGKDTDNSGRILEAALDGNIEKVRMLTVLMETCGRLSVEVTGEGKVEWLSEEATEKTFTMKFRVIAAGSYQLVTRVDGTITETRHFKCDHDHDMTDQLPISPGIHIKMSGMTGCEITAFVYDATMEPISPELTPNRELLFQEQFPSLLKFKDSKGMSIHGQWFFFADLDSYGKMDPPYQKSMHSKPSAAGQPTFFLLNVHIAEGVEEKERYVEYLIRQSLSIPEKDIETTELKKLAPEKYEVAVQLKPEKHDEFQEVISTKINQIQRYNEHELGSDKKHYLVLCLPNTRNQSTALLYILHSSGMSENFFVSNGSVLNNAKETVPFECMLESHGDVIEECLKTMGKRMKKRCEWLLKTTRKGVINPPSSSSSTVTSSSPIVQSPTRQAADMEPPGLITTYPDFKILTPFPGESPVFTHFRFKNTTRRQISYRIQLYDIDTKRLEVDHSFGTLEPEESRKVLVTCAPFEIGQEDIDKDFVVLKWINTPIGGSEEHSDQWFEQNGIVLRKHMKLEYR